MKENNGISEGAVDPAEVAGLSPFSGGLADVRCGDSLDWYGVWDRPDVIVSDGAYGLLGFEGDTSDHLGIPSWYEPHVRAWSEFSKPGTTLWFWNSEIGWAAAHPVLESHGWRYQSCNVWNKGMAHVAGNVNTSTIRRFPVVTEVCVQYVRESRIGGLSLQDWLRSEWIRTGLPLRRANEACGVRDAATRKYLDRGSLWYFPPPEMFGRMQRHANEFGDPAGRPYFSADGIRPLTDDEWSGYRAEFECPHGHTNVWSRPAVNGAERIRSSSGKAFHLNQKPLDLMRLIIGASSREGDVVWEPFGGLFTASLAACSLGRKAYACEINPHYYAAGASRLRQALNEPSKENQP